MFNSVTEFIAVIIAEAIPQLLALSKKTRDCVTASKTENVPRLVLEHWVGWLPDLFGSCRDKHTLN